MLNPKITKDSNGVYWLEWTPDPSAEGYAITTPGGASRTFNPAAKKSKLGKHAEPVTATVGALDVTARAVESATYPPVVVPPPTPTARVRMEAGVLTWDPTPNATGYVVAEVRPGEVIKKTNVGPNGLTYSPTPHPGETDEYDVRADLGGALGPWYGRTPPYKWPGVVVDPPPVDPPPVDPPPTGGKLRKPPGYTGGDPKNPASYPGFVVKDVTQIGTVAMDDSKDYFLRLNVDANAPGSGGRPAVYLSGGRHVVVIGGVSKIRPTTAGGDIGDCTAIIVDDGNPSGVVHLEGCDFASANGVTIRTKRQVRLQYVRIVCKTLGGPGAGGVHADIVSTWDRGPCPLIAIDYLTSECDYTGLSTLMDPNPDRWELANVNMRFVPGHSGPSVYYGNDKKQNSWFGTNCYFNPQDSDCKLDDALAGWGEDNIAYEIIRKSDGQKYTSPDPPLGGNSPFGNQAGDRITFARNLPGMSWTYGDPPGGDFVKAGSVGAAYVPKGYA